MEYSEYPGVEEGIGRKFKFSKIKWLTKLKFLTETTKTTNNIQPRLNDHKDSNKLEFIGKSIPKRPPVLVAGEEITLAQPAFEFFEIAGTVFKSNEPGNVWKLRITHDSRVYEIEDNFLVLSIEDPNSFYWCSNIDTNDNSYSFQVNYKEIPRYALRICVDKVDNQYSYLGRSINENDELSEVPKAKRPKFYSNGWCHFDENMPQIFGKVNKTFKLLFAPFKNLEIGHDQYETLCLKASPGSLSILCRSALRSYLSYSQKKIKAINTSERKLVPDSLIQFLKYPAHLNVGEWMLRDEKLVQQDDQFELAIDENTGNLVFRSLNLEQRPVKSFVIARNIDSIWLHRFHTVFYNHDSTTYTAHSLYNSIAAYKFFIEWDNSTSTENGQPNSQIKQL